MNFETWINGKLEGVCAANPSKVLYYFQIDRRIFQNNTNISFTIWFERKKK